MDEFIQEYLAGMSWRWIRSKPYTEEGCERESTTDNPDAGQTRPDHLAD